MGDWISVKDSLPKVGVSGVYGSGVVLVAELGEIYTAIFVKINSRKSWWKMSHLDERLNHVTHWMPLPEPPKESN